MHIKDCISNKTRVEVILVNNFDFRTYGHAIKNSICAVIDTFMAVSTITTILGSNCKRIILAREKNEAYKLKEIFKDYLLCGEENGLPIEGFNYSNRPLNFVNMDLSEKKFIFSTTNGSVSFFKLIKSKIIFALSLLNLQSCINIIAKCAINHKKNILFLCSGRKGFPAYEDIYTSGLAIKYLQKIVDLEISDSSQIALEIAHRNNKHLINILSGSETGQIIKRLGYLGDMEYCLKMNIYDVIPRLTVLELKEPIKDILFTEYKDIFNLIINLPNKPYINNLLLLEPNINSS